MKKFINWMSIAACVAFAGTLASGLSTTASAQENVPVFDRLPLFGEPDVAEELPASVSKPKIAAMPDRDAIIKASGESEPDWQARSPSLDRRVESPSLNKRPTAAELRQARAMYSMKHMMARTERDAWRGREPLRPSFHGIPNAVSVFYGQPRYVVPIYYFGR